MTITNLSRRSFLQGTGGLCLGFYLPGCAVDHLVRDKHLSVGDAISEGPEVAINAWIHIARNNVVTLQVGASEMGQGIFTSLPMILAEHLDCDWSLVRAESSGAHAEYRREASFGSNKQITGGSESIVGYFDLLAKAGSTARAMLVTAAAQRWRVAASSLTTDAGAVVNGDQRLTYGELADEAAGLKPGDVAPITKSDWRILGTNPRRLELPAKCNGTPNFGIDVVVDNMRYATVMHCPHHGGTLLDFDDSEARKSSDVIDIFAVGQDKVVCVANSFFAAQKGIRAVVFRWDKGAGAGLDDAEIGRRLEAGIESGLHQSFAIGDMSAEPTITATYEVPFLEHAPLEPLNATAWVTEGRVEIWAPTQAPQAAQKRAAEIAGVKPEDVRLHTTMLGGGFGRKSFTDFTDLAVEISIHIGNQPVKLIYTREQCFARGYYRPRILCHHAARLDENGLPVDWHMRVAGQNVAAALVPKMFLNMQAVEEIVVGGLNEMPYAIPNRRTDFARIELPIPVGWWRSVHGSTNGFIRECFIDEMAHAGGQDPIEMRLTLLKNNPREKRVYEAAIEAAGPLADGLSRGTALFSSFGSICAQVADIEVIDGEVFVRRVGAAIDCGTALHPENVKYQVQGALTMGISAMLNEAVSFVDGAAVPTNFDSYPLLQMKQAPVVNVVVVNSGEELGGVGEPGLPPIAGAVGNAIFAATGIRVRKLPVGKLQSL